MSPGSVAGRGTHREMVGLNAVHTAGGGAGCKVRTETERKDSLQQLGADKHKRIMHHLECHCQQEILLEGLGQGTQQPAPGVILGRA